MEFASLAKFQLRAAFLWGNKTKVSTNRRQLGLGRFTVKKLLASLAVIALTVPSVASAQGAAEALSLKSAAVKQVRASAKPGAKKAAGSTGLLIVAIGLLGAGAAALAGNKSNTTSLSR